MGMDLTETFHDGDWFDGPPTDGPYLTLEVHDSDIAVIRHSPSIGHGICFLGLEPRHYFESTEANEPVDTLLEARSLASWSHKVTGASVTVEEIIPLLADPRGGDPINVFVEDTTRDLLRLLGVPIPPTLSGG